tara:strand:+ start:371 stop:592 length:222 start_codon:yes stop_codon:yes gene_type:complete
MEKEIILFFESSRPQVLILSPRSVRESFLCLSFKMGNKASSEIHEKELSSFVRNQMQLIDKDLYKYLTNILIN